MTHIWCKICQKIVRNAWYAWVIHIILHLECIKCIKVTKNIPIQAKGMSLQMQRIKWSWLQKHIISNSQQIPHYEYRVIFLSSNDIVRLITISSKNQCVVIIWLKQNGGYFFSLLTFPAPSPLRALESLRWPAGFPRGKVSWAAAGIWRGTKIVLQWLQKRTLSLRTWGQHISMVEKRPFV